MNQKKEEERDKEKARRMRDLYRVQGRQTAQAFSKSYSQYIIIIYLFIYSSIYLFAYASTYIF